MMKKQIGAFVLASALTLTALSGCSRVEQPTTGTLGSFPTASGTSSALSSSELEESSALSSSLASSVTASAPAPAVEQPITGKVTEDPQFKPTEKDEEEDPQRGDNDHSAGRDDEDKGSGGTITVPDLPPSGGGTSSAPGTSSTVTSSVSSKPGSSSSPAGSSSKPSSSSSAPASSSSQSSSSEASSSAPAPTWPTDKNYTGWWETAGKRYCFVNGKKLTGWQNVNNVGYYFDSEGAVSSKCGIDVSKYQGTIDWKKVKADGIDFVFVRAGYRGYETGKIVIDTKFVENVKGAHDAGLEVGVYFFSQAINAAEGKAEAEWTLNAVQDFPYIQYLAIDTENATGTPGQGRADNISKEARTDAMEAFCREVESKGKKSMIYASQSWFENKLILSRLTMAEKWVARWASSITWSQPFSVWQSCSDGKVNGISGNVDRNAWKMD